MRFNQLRIVICGIVVGAVSACGSPDDGVPLTNGTGTDTSTDTDTATTGGTGAAGTAGAATGGVGDTGGTGGSGTDTVDVTVGWAQINSQEPDWYTTPEARQIAENILYYQTTTGGWTSRVEMLDRSAYKQREDWGFHRQLVFLGKMIAATADDRYKASFERGIDRLMQIQLPNGAWMEQCPYAVYYDTIVRYIDEGMTGYINILNEVAIGSPDYAFVAPALVERAQVAVNKGIDYMLKTQIIVQGQKTAWPAHPHKETYLPHTRSPYEVRGISGHEGVSVFEFLMKVANPCQEVMDAIDAAAAWYEANKFVGWKVEDVLDAAGGKIDRVLVEDPASTIWARYYDVETVLPIFGGRDGITRHNLADVPLERRIKFDWYSTRPAAALEAYATWKTTVGAQPRVPCAPLVIDPQPPYCGPIPTRTTVFPGDPPGKPRVIATTDGERDDKSSMVRFLLYASDYDIAGIVEVNSRYQKFGHSRLAENKSPTEEVDWMSAHFDAYEAVLPNLRVHNPDYPDTALLRAVHKIGNENVNDIHRAPPDFETQDTEGSQIIIDTLLDDDPRPVHILSWGGANTTAYALYKIKTFYTAEQFRKAVEKARIYVIYYQDSGGYWIEDNIPGAYIYESYAWDTVWNYQSIFGPSPDDIKAYMNDVWLTTNITTGHGLMGGRYSQEAHAQTYISEGDTPSFLPLMNNGLEQHLNYTWGGWGGRPVFDWVLHMSDGWDVRADTGECNRQYTYWRWIPAAQNDFQARLDWSNTAVFAEANHNPVAAVTPGTRINATVGEIIALDASGSTDPDTNLLSFNWWQYAEADTASTEVVITGAATAAASFTVPDEPGKQVHIILEVTDNGVPPLTNYKRVIVDIL